MNLPIYQHITLKKPKFEELSQYLKTDMNLRHPVVINLIALNKEEQNEMIIKIQDRLETLYVSYTFPYPIYIITSMEQSKSQIPFVQSQEELPAYFSHKESKTNVKENQIVEKNKLLQQEIRNSDPVHTRKILSQYGKKHKKVYSLQRELSFYQNLITKINKKAANDG